MIRVNRHILTVKVGVGNMAKISCAEYKRRYFEEGGKPNWSTLTLIEKKNTV